MRRHTPNSYFVGGFYRICDDCGRKRRARDTAKKWNGMIVCADTCIEERNPQDFVRAHHDNQTVPEPRPENTGSRLRIDIESLTIDNEYVNIDQQGDRFLDTNEVSADDL